MSTWSGAGKSGRSRSRRHARARACGARGRNGDANEHTRGGARLLWRQREKNKYQVKPHPGFYVTHRDWPVFWLAVILPRSCLPVRCTVAYDRRRQAYSSGGCAGLARDENPARHRLPVSPSRRQAGGHRSRIQRAFYTRRHFAVQAGAGAPHRRIRSRPRCKLSRLRPSNKYLTQA